MIYFLLALLCIAPIIQAGDNDDQWIFGFAPLYSTEYITKYIKETEKLILVTMSPEHYDVMAKNSLTCIEERIKELDVIGSLGTHFEKNTVFHDKEINIEKTKETLLQLKKICQKKSYTGIYGPKSVRVNTKYL